ncbi:hypothetical protein VPHD274_0019 [Vibrio phage D274]
MGFGEALAQTLGTAVSTASGTAIDIAKRNREEAIQREGWDRQDARTVQQQEFTAAENEKSRVARAGEAEAGRKFQVEQADIKYGRDKELAALKGQKPLETKITNTDQGTFATVGDRVFRVTESGLEPLDISTNAVPEGETVTGEDLEEPGFFEKAIQSGKSWLSGLSGNESEAPASMADAAAPAPKVSREDVRNQLQVVIDEDQGFGKADSLIRNSGLPILDQLALYAIYSNPVEKTDSSPAGKTGANKFEGKSYGQSEFDKVKEKYPNASEEQVLKSLEAFYNKQ